MAEQDKFIFELFNLGQKVGIGQKPKKEISKEEILTMLYNLPRQGVIVATPKREDSKEAALAATPQYDYSIRISSKPKTHERLVIDNKKYFEIMPEHITLIADAMLRPYVDTAGMVNLEQFRKFLEKNTALRTLVQLSVKPSLWTLNEKGYAQYHAEDVVYDFEIGNNDGSNIKSTVIDSKENVQDQSS